MQKARKIPGTVILHLSPNTLCLPSRTRICNASSHRCEGLAFPDPTSFTICCEAHCFYLLYCMMIRHIQEDWLSLLEHASSKHSSYFLHVCPVLRFPRWFVYRQLHLERQSTMSTPQDDFFNGITRLCGVYPQPRGRQTRAIRLAETFGAQDGDRAFGTSLAIRDRRMVTVPRMRDFKGLVHVSKQLPAADRTYGFPSVQILFPWTAARTFLVSDVSRARWVQMWHFPFRMTWYFSIS